MLIPKRVFELYRTASTDAYRYQLNGVLLERVDEETARAVSTDGKCMTVVTWKDSHREEYPARDGGDPAAAREGFSAIVPLRDCRELGKMVPKCSVRPILENVALDETPTEGPLTFSATDLDSSTSREVTPVDGIFPDYRSVVPKKDGDQVMIDARSMVNALTTLLKANELGRKESAYTTVTLTPDGKGPMKLELVEKAGRDVEVVVYCMPVVVE